ncbi:MAG: hypothetical protein LBQ67_00735, partial [Treponema sp.]|nr:hypothetical protein [Treponema sp.]
MDSLLQLFGFILVGLILLWFGFTLFFRIGKKGDNDGRGHSSGGRLYKQGTNAPREGGAGSPRSCPVCGILLEHGELVKSSAFPDPGNGRGRLMHIAGCVYCLEGSRSAKRKCPVCGAPLSTEEILFARMFDKPGRS